MYSQFDFDTQRISISHPMSDEIRIVDHQYAHCDNGISSEIAFFNNGKWVTSELPEFSEYSEGDCGETMVYGYVPNELIESFLEKHEVL